MRSKSVTLMNGATIEWPYMATVGAGWHLRPDEARTDHEIRRGLNKSFGRGWEGKQAAEKWLENWLQKQFDDNNWEPVVSYDYTKWSPYLYGGIELEVKKPEGFHALNLKVNDSPRKSVNNATVVLTYHAPNIFRWYKDKAVTLDEPGHSKEVSKFTWEYPSHDAGIYELVEAFSKDPIGFAAKQQIEFPMDKDDLPPLQWNGLKETDTYLDPEEKIRIKADADHAFYRQGNHAEEVLSTSSEAIGQLERALRHMNISFRILTSHVYDYSSSQYNQRVVSGFEIVIPSDETDEHNKRGHTIQVTTKGAKITCGYRQDDEKYQEWQARQLAGWLNEFESDTLSTPTYEDYEYKPNQTEVH